MRVVEAMTGLIIACATALGVGLPPKVVVKEQLSVADDATSECETTGCKSQNAIVTNEAGSANTCGVVVDVVINPIPDTNVDGRCVCGGPGCKSVAGRFCRANATVTVTVTHGSGYIFCHSGWTVTGNSAIIALDSGTIPCDKTGAGSSGTHPTTMSIQCGATCGPSTIGSSAVLIVARSQPR